MEVHLIDSMGSDVRVCDAARVSFRKVVPEGVLRDSDIRLINYLAKHNHWTPFAHTVVTLHLKMPIFIARQFAKHTVGLVTNEVSRRYVDDVPEFFYPKEWRSRPLDGMKQGSGGFTIDWLDLDEHEVWDDPSSPPLTVSIKEVYDTLLEQSNQLYDLMIKNDVAPEQARMILPQSMMTEMYTTGSLVAWARIWKLRSDPHAQMEIQELAHRINTEIQKIPGLDNSWKALTEVENGEG